MVAVLLAPNTPETLAVRYATHLLGGAVCYLRTTNPGTKTTLIPQDHQIQILRETGAVTVYTDAECQNRAVDIARQFGVPVTKAAADAPALPLTRENTPSALKWHPDALAVISYTSGSTGRPKGIRLSGRAWEATVRGWMELGNQADCASILVSTPLSHGVAAMADAVLLLGGTLHLQERFDPEEFVGVVAAEPEIDWTFMATNHVFQLIDYLLDQGIGDRPAVEAAGLSSLKRIVYGGSAAAPARTTQAHRLLGPILWQGYAATECGRITTLTPDEHADADLSATVGRPFTGVEIAICDSESGAALATGEVGEVCVRSPQTMDGYNGEPELTARALRHGWYYTGDVGYLDDRGYLTLLSRVADVIKVGGVKVHPLILEAEITNHPGVRNAAVYGVRDADGSEHIHAAIECDPTEGAVDVDSIRVGIAQNLSDIHVPEKITLLNKLPLNSNGKPDKPLLRAECN
jgi:fatty-acyl-CoA synthase